MEENTFPLLIKVSKIISNFFNPLFSLILYFVFYSSIHFKLKESTANFFPILLIIVIPITSWIFYQVKSGNYTNADVSNRNERKSLYFFIAASLSLYITYNYFVNEAVDLVVCFILMLLLLLQISNYYIKSSMHVAFNIFVAALYFPLSFKLGIIWFGIAVCVGITRIILKRHTIQEVFFGAIIAIIVSFLYLYTTIQIKN